jgi:hypothetical protein
MNVSVEFNQIAQDSNRRTRISVLRKVDLDAAISMSMALRDNPEVEAVILVEGDRPVSRIAGLAGRLASGLAGWLHDARQPASQPRAQQGARQPRPLPAPGRLAPAA